MSNKKNKQAYEKKPNASNKQNSGKKQNVKKAQEIKKAQEMKREQRNKKIFGVSVAACAAVILIVSLVVIHGNNKDSSDSSAFSYSEGIDENGFWEDINALDYVEIFNYQSLSIPSDAYQISDGDLQSAIDTLLANYAPEEKQVMDRAVADGDKVNIDYVGSVDGVEFEGGSTGGEGADVTAGDTDYIDDFLTQIIGHMPGETINVEVTFPDVYESNPDLAGKDAVFVTTINYIAETVLTDEFVEENLSGEYGWKTVREMEDGEREELKKAAIENYIKEYMQSDVTVSSVPDKLTEYQEASMLDYYQGYAEGYEMELDDFLSEYAGFSNVDELIENSKEENLNNAIYSLVVQAVAEDAGLSVSDEDMEEYVPDYSSYIEQYGLPWLKQYALGLKVLNYIAENAVLA